MGILVCGHCGSTEKTNRLLIKKIEKLEHELELTKNSGKLALALEQGRFRQALEKWIPHVRQMIIENPSLSWIIKEMEELIKC